MRDHQLPFDPALIAPGDFTRPAGEAALHLLHDQRNVAFEAVVAANDELALGALKGLHQRGIRVPKDAAVVGFDNIAEAEVVTPPLTTISQPIYQQGEQAARMMLALLDREEVAAQQILPTELVIRRSCGCADPVITQVATGVIQVQDEPFDLVLHTQQPDILRTCLKIHVRCPPHACHGERSRTIVSPSFDSPSTRSGQAAQDDECQEFSNRFLEPGDGIVLFTDGITEAENIDRELYGIDRLCRVIGEHWNKSAEEIKTAVFKDVNKFIGKQKVHDDLTLVILKHQ